MPSKFIKKNIENTDVYWDPYTLIRVNFGIKNLLKVPIAHAITETYIVSFPKCGRTWLRMLLAHYFSLEYNVDINPEILIQWRQNIRVPRIRFTHLGSDQLEYLENQSNFLNYRRKKLLYMIRDPRDVVVSYYYHITKRWGSKPRDVSDIDDFAFHSRYGIPRIVYFYNWMINKVRMLPKVNIVSYENMHVDTEKTLKEILQFITNKMINTSYIEKAVQMCSFELMQLNEAQNRVDHQALKAKDIRDPNSFKAREGRIGSHKEHLSKQTIKAINAYLIKYLDVYYDRYRIGSR